MNLTKLRFWFAMTALVALAVAFCLVLFFGAHLTEVQVAVLTPIAMALIFEAKSASSFIFDGVPPQPDTTSTTVSKVTPPPEDATQAPSFPAPPTT